MYFKKLIITIANTKYYDLHMRTKIKISTYRFGKKKSIVFKVVVDTSVLRKSTTQN